MLFIFEGIDGVGKTTLAEETYKYLSKKYGQDKVILYPILKVIEGDGNDQYHRDRYNKFKSNQMTVYETAEYLSSTIIYNSLKIKELVEQDKHVICDRHYMSFYAYQVYSNPEIEEYVSAFFKIISQDLLPVKTILFHVIHTNKTKLLARINKRGYDGLDEVAANNYEKILKGYKDYFNIYHPHTIPYFKVINESTRDIENIVRLVDSFSKTFDFPEV